MKKSDVLKQQRTAKLQAQKRIIDAAKAENRDFTEQEQTDLDALDGEVLTLEADIQKAEANEAREARIASLTGVTVGKGEEEEQRRMEKRFSIGKAYRQAASGSLDGVEKELNDIGVKEMRGVTSDGIDIQENSFTIPSSMARAAQTVTEDGGEYGSQLVPVTPRIVDGFIPRLFLEKLGATLMSGLRGNVPLPVAGNFEFEWLAETAEIDVSAVKIEGPVLSPKRAAGAAKVSLQLINQSSVDAENLIWKLIRDASSRAIQRAAINGAGGVAPLGLLNMTGILSAASTTPHETTFKDILELEGLVEDADATDISLGYLLRSKLASSLRGIKKDPGSGRFLMENNSIEGVQTAISSLVPELAGNQVLIYGDWSQLFIGQWGGLNIVVDPYGGAKSGSILSYLNMYADVQVANKKGFAVNKFLTV